MLYMYLNEKDLIWKVVDGLISLIVVINSQCAHLSKLHIVHLKYVPFCLPKITKNENELKKEKSESRNCM